MEHDRAETFTVGELQEAFEKWFPFEWEDVPEEEGKKRPELEEDSSWLTTMEILAVRRGQEPYGAIYYNITEVYGEEDPEQNFVQVYLWRPPVVLARSSHTKNFRRMAFQYFAATTLYFLDNKHPVLYERDFTNEDLKDIEVHPDGRWYRGFCFVEKQSKEIIRFRNPPDDNSRMERFDEQANITESTPREFAEQIEKKWSGEPDNYRPNYWDGVVMDTRDTFHEATNDVIDWRTPPGEEKAGGGIRGDIMKDGEKIGRVTVELTGRPMMAKIGVSWDGGYCRGETSEELKERLDVKSKEIKELLFG